MKSKIEAANAKPGTIRPKPKLVVIVGPTASGKTSLGIELAKKFSGEIVSADSRQIYRTMDIGTAKASKEDRDDVPHHLIDIRNPDEDYNVADFKRDAENAIDEIISRGKLPLLVGGTGLYVRSVVENLDIPEIKADPELRRKIEAEIEQRGLPEVFKKLIDLDPEAAYVVDPKNPRRIVRALEVATITGKPFTAQRRKNESQYNALEIGINPLPEILRTRIEVRIDEMIEDGLVDEVKKLLKNYGKIENGRKHYPVSFDAIGYREIIDALEGPITLDDAIAAMKLNTWHFAKRQVTWFKKDKKIQWIENSDEAIKIVEEFLTEKIF